MSQPGCRPVERSNLPKSISAAPVATSRDRGVQLGIAYAGRRFLGHPCVEFRVRDGDTRTGGEAAGLDGVELLPGGRVVVICGCREGSCDKQDRNCPKTTLHEYIDAWERAAVARE